MKKKDGGTGQQPWDQNCIAKSKQGDLTLSKNPRSLQVSRTSYDESMTHHERAPFLLQLLNQNTTD
jgi:hypothetical protein